MTWTELIRSARGRWATAFCVLIVFLMIGYMPTYYQEVILPKPGVLLSDPVLNLFTPVDWSTTVFVILAIAIAQTFIAYAGSPTIFLTALLTFCAVNVVRMITMYVFTLEPPADMILLIDPISANLVYPNQAFAKDLFFSGHVSTMMVLLLVERRKFWVILKLVGTVLMAIFLAWQHVHYTIDLLVAPLATYLVFLAVRSYIHGIPTENNPA